MSKHDSSARKDNRDNIKRMGASKMKRQRIGRLLSECGEPITITLSYPNGLFGFPVRGLDPVTRALIDTACAERGLR